VPGDPESYGAVHARLHRGRGKAAQFACAAPACDAPARVWAWQRTGPSRSGTRGGWPVTYGLNVEDYSPMCYHHALMLDNGGTLTHYPCGHIREGNAEPDGRCRICRNAKRREKRRKGLPT